MEPLSSSCAIPKSASRCIREPSILVYTDHNETESVSEIVPSEATVVDFDSTGDAALITALACHTDGNRILCGKSNGAVSRYTAKSGKELEQLYRHTKGISMTSMDVGGTSDIVVSADASGRLLVLQSLRKESQWVVKRQRMDARVPDYAISQILLNAEHDHFLVCTIVSDTL